ncbi:hypothetical protein BKA25_002868 [Actinoalloteichus hymeniacidonis]|uniref:Uncharacterized protein n=1 Tax=Actinoalloteichus hymeniacidonis TaxID=340345 RepID=A0AAC9MYV9_9PSEU|nr:hypothetical protein TL08_12965 [Actinoalloteichus hymeniacidonis]MBB5908552.1 hypothetical protein [Actinoalloteichus hymeniacidonis]
MRQPKKPRPSDWLLQILSSWGATARIVVVMFFLFGSAWLTSTDVEVGPLKLTNLDTNEKHDHWAATSWG